MNVVYFVCHDIGRALGCYGAAVPTPRLDEFAGEAVRFTNAHCSSPACSPSRACAMSGEYAHRTGAIGLSHLGWPLPLDVRTTVDDFNDAGYETILSGINHERHPRTDRYAVDLSRDWDDWKVPRAVDNALDHLARREAGRPFYLNVACQEPHACTWGEVGARIPALPEDFEPWFPAGMPRTPALAAAFRRFAASAAYMDAHFGRFVDGLRRLGLLDDTMIGFTTDHGIAGPRGKGTLLGLGTEIALMIRLPGGEHGGETREQLISNVDFRATWREACGLGAAGESDGRSFWPVLADAEVGHHEAIFLERNFHGEKPWRTEPKYVDCYDPTRAVRTRDHLYVRHFRPEAKPPEPLPGGIDARETDDWSEWEKSWVPPVAKRAEEELYELEGDPNEVRDVAGDAAMEGVRSELRGRLENWMRQTGDFLPNEPPFQPEALGWGSGWPAS